MELNSNCGRIIVCIVLALVFTGNSLSNPSDVDVSPSAMDSKTLESREGLFWEEIERQSNDTNLVRKKRVAILPLVPLVPAVASLVVGLTTLIGNAFDPSCREYGCNEGYCWAYCSIGNQWCYTTRNGTWKGDYVQCSSKDDCDGCWKCGGACTI